MKHKFLGCLLALLCLFGITDVYAMPGPTNEFYINDYANLLSEETEHYILNTSAALAKETTAQVVVVTVPSLDGMTIEDYAVQLYRQYGIGTSEDDNGLLLLLALEERQFRVEVGYGLESVLPDGLTGRYQDEYIIPYLRENNWDQGVKNGYNAFVKKICDYYNVDSLQVESVIEQEPYTPKYDETLAIASIVGFIFGAILGIFAVTKAKTPVMQKVKTTITTIICVANLPAHIIFNSLSKEIGSFAFFATEIFMFIIIVISSKSPFSTGGYYRHRSGGRSSGGSSFGGFSGGGGRSGGGGSTRGF